MSRSADFEKRIPFTRAVQCAIGAAVILSHATGEDDAPSIPRTILKAIGSLEGQNDPKCHATASRLEGLIYGTPLSDEARFAKNALLKDLVVASWREASKGSDKAEVESGMIEAALGKRFVCSKDEKGDWAVRFEGGGDRKVVVTARDLQHYGSVAYSLRAILAAQQESLFGASRVGPPLSDEAVRSLKKNLDLLQLALLQVADRQARAADEEEISKARLEGIWSEHIAVSTVPLVIAERKSPDVLREVIKQKAASYQAYNEVSAKVFVRNMQVYFARLSWPKDPKEATAFRQQFTEMLVAFAGDLYLMATDLSRERDETIVREQDVAAAAQRFLPHAVNEHEDVIFFPKLPHEQRVVIESYDLDAFRDSGGHWHYLGFALDDLKNRELPDADPFAAELLAENVAQFGVMLLRVTGREGIRLDQERLSTELLELAARRIQTLITRHAEMKDHVGLPPKIASAENGTGGAASFKDVTEASGVRFEHRSSSWLNRLLRTYLKTPDDKGNLTIPHAFAGSGVAAEDLDGDGKCDLLLLSGSGNRLYQNAGGGKFRDVTEGSGLVWLRPDDRLPGEPRQPLVADFDNDGNQDILITYANDPHRLYRGLGNMKFEDVTSNAGLGGEGLVGGPATTFDFDNDGLLDIYISYFGDFVRGVLPTLKRRNNNGLPNKLFRNLGEMRFEDVTERAGVGDAGWGQASLHVDFDGDSWQDLISGNDFGVNYYYRNNRNGTFREVSGEIGTDKPSYTMSLSAADLNGDLLPDLYVSNIVTMNKDEKYVLPNEDTRMKFNLEKLANLRTVEANDLFLSRDGGEKPVSFLLSRMVLSRDHASTGWAWDADFFDADHDGDDDLYVLNGMNEFNLYSSHNPYFMDAKEMKKSNRFLPVAEKEPNVFFENRDGKLRNASATSGLDFLGNSRSAVFFDLESDGDLDVATNDYHGPARVFENRLKGDGGNWIKLRLVGDPAKGINRDSIGSVVVITLPDGTTVWRQVFGSTGYMSVHPKEIHAGVGDANHVDVNVRWPNGDTQKLERLATSKSHTIRCDVR